MIPTDFADRVDAAGLVAVAVVLAAVLAVGAYALARLDCLQDVAQDVVERRAAA